MLAILGGYACTTVCNEFSSTFLGVPVPDPEAAAVTEVAAEDLGSSSDGDTRPSLDGERERERAGWFSMSWGWVWVSSSSSSIHVSSSGSSAGSVGAWAVGGVLAFLATSLLHK